MPTSHARTLADELSVRENQIRAAIELLDGGATVPFVARYRKEATGGLDDTQLRQLDERLRYLRELDDRRESILGNLREQGKLTADLESGLRAADSKTRLEDLYLPFRQKRRTRAQIAREAGLEPLADALLADRSLDPEQAAAAYLDVDRGIEDTRSALDGARQILMERFAEDADLAAAARDFLAENALLAANVVTGKEEEGAKFSDYFEHTEPLASVPSHRALAMFRGRNEGVLQLHLVMSGDEAPEATHPCEGMVARHWGLESICGDTAPGSQWLATTLRWTWRVKLFTRLQTDLLGELRARAEAEAIRVFANNLKDLLMAAPAGQRPTIGLDPGLRTGVKVAVVDGTGRLLDHATIYPHAPRSRTGEARATLGALIEKHGAELIAIGNGTASRETDRFVGELLSDRSELNCRKVMVSEAGASVYSASAFAAAEFPDLDVTIRGAVSIARRLQDPLAELVKIEPRSIGVGQYQHDVSQVQLGRQLDSAVEDCVNAVGVDVNTASVPLLARVSGLNQGIAENIVALRDQEGGFANRRALLGVSRFGERTFEQAAGFLRIMDGDNPLDASAVHPESYGVVEHIAAREARPIPSMLGDSAFLGSLRAADYVSAGAGLETVSDILQELNKPGRDPRPEFRVAAFREGVETMADLQAGMVLEGTVTNVTNFGAFVDIGVHQDGLVHISALADRFVKDPREVVKAGDIVRVKVMEVEPERRRIGLSMRLGDEPGESRQRQGKRNQKPGSKPRERGKKERDKKQPPPAGNAFANAFARARKER